MVLRRGPSFRRFSINSILGLWLHENFLKAGIILLFKLRKDQNEAPQHQETLHITVSLAYKFKLCPHLCPNPILHLELYTVCTILYTNVYNGSCLNQHTSVSYSNQ